MMPELGSAGRSGRPDSNRLPSAWKADVQPVTPRRPVAVDYRFGLAAQPTTGSALAPGEDDRVGLELAVGEARLRGAPPHSDSDIAEAALQEVAAVEARVQPAPDHLARSVVVAEVLGETKSLVAMRIAGPLHAAAQARLTGASVAEAVLRQHRVGVVLGGALEAPIRVELVEAAAPPLVVHEAGHRLAQLAQRDLVGMRPGVRTRSAGRGKPGARGER